MRKTCFFLLSFASLLIANPTDLDTLFRGKEYKPILNEALRSASDKNNEIAFASSKTDKTGEGYYVLQFEAVADFDAAQRRKAQLSASTGYAIQVVFDTPFYKLRGGGWTSKAKAEDKARELSANNINALVIKIR
ncbi:MAG TPA: SPOR domain-containing protein [Fibrobacter sp.]|nr:SPOR domain-containing protein [Fibrobacter sp.]